MADAATTLDPVAETAEVQRMINAHNTAINSGNHALLAPLEIRRTVFFTGYLISSVDTDRLLKLLNLPPSIPQSEVRFLADNIIITPRPCPRSILDKVGGIGRKQTWQVTGLGCYESRVWAARVTPIPADAPYHTDNPFPLVVLAVVRGSRPADAARIQNWQLVPAGKQIVFQTEVGEKVQLRVEAEGEYEKIFVNRNLKRQRDGPTALERDSFRFTGSRRGGYGDENRRPNGINGGYNGGNQNRGRGGNNNSNSRYDHRNTRGGRGAGNRMNNNNTNNSNGNRGRGGRGGYKSLDDVQHNPRYANQGSSYQPNYDDGPSNFTSGADGYNASFPALGGGSSYNSGAQGNGDGGLPYGK